MAEKILSIRIEESLIREFKLAAIKNGETMQSAAAKILEEYVRANGGTQ